MKQQLQDSSFLYQTVDVFPCHSQVYFGGFWMFWACWILGNLCLQRAWLELWALMSKHVQACLGKCWPQTPPWCWHWSAWDQSQPWWEQDLCNSLEGRDLGLFYPKNESRKHNCKAQPGSGADLLPLGDWVWNKALPGLPGLFARCGFPVFQSTNCVPGGGFYGWARTCSKTIKDSVALEGEGRDREGGGERWPRGNGRTCYPSQTTVSINTCKTDVVNTLPRLPARVPLLQRPLLTLLPLLS